MDYTAQIKTPIPLLLLDEQKSPLPRWMKYYIPVSLVLYVCLMMYSVAYLIYVGIKLSDNLMLIQYEPVSRLLKCNSYSLLPPFVSFIVFPSLMYITKNKVKVEDGEFFGILGGLLLLCIISAYDATGVFQLYADRGDFLRTKSRHPETEVSLPNEENELAWQYAWSTKPSCARIHAILNRMEAKQRRANGQHERMEVDYGPETVKERIPFEHYAWFFQMMTKDEILNAGFAADVHQARQGAALTSTIDERTSSGRQYIYECKNTSDSSAPVTLRDWMKDMHMRLQCCGPRGYEEFQTKIILGKLGSCKNGNKYYKRGCGIPFNQFLRKLMYEIMIVLYMEAVCYLTATILACFHFAAMKYDASGMVKEYSLLDLDGKSAFRFGQNMLAKKGPPRSRIDPVESLFIEANRRAESRRNSTADLHFPAVLSSAHPDGAYKRKGGIMGYDHHHEIHNSRPSASMRPDV